MYLLAFLTEPEILYRMPFDDSRKYVLGLLIDKGLVVHMDVKERMAFPAYKMRVGRHMSVEAVGSVGGNLDNLSQIRQQRQVAVDSAEADIRKFLADIQINGLGGRVIIPGYKKILDRLPLFTVLQHGYDTSFR